MRPSPSGSFTGSNLSSWEPGHTVRDKSPPKMAKSRGSPAMVASPFKSDLKVVRDLNLTEAGRKVRNSGTLHVLDMFRRGP